MIFNLVKRAKEIFINKSNTGVEADNVEDAIKVLNFKLGNVKSINLYTKAVQRNATYANMAQFIIPNASAKKLFVTLGNGVDFPTYITRVSVTGEVVQVVFKDSLTAGVTYPFEILAVEI